jgi:hypothetical protein
MTHPRDYAPELLDLFTVDLPEDELPTKES